MREVPSLLSSPRLRRPRPLSTGSQAGVFSRLQAAEQETLPSVWISLPLEGAGGARKAKGKKQKREKLDPSGQREPPRVAVASSFPEAGIPHPSQPRPRPPSGSCPAGRWAWTSNPCLTEPRGGRGGEPAPRQPGGGGAPAREPGLAALPAPPGTGAGALAHAGPRLVLRPERSHARLTMEVEDSAAWCSPLTTRTRAPAAQPRAALRAPGDRQPPRQWWYPHRPPGTSLLGWGSGVWWFHRQLGFPPAEDHHRQIVVSSFGGRDGRSLWFFVLSSEDVGQARLARVVF